MEIGKQIEKNGWRQGSFLAADLAAQARTPTGELVQPTADEFFMVVSQSCDLVHGRVEDEPWCDILRLVPIGGLDSRFMHGRNGRELQFEIHHQGISQAVRALAPHRCFLSRTVLANACPVTSVECRAETLRVVREWLGKRYTRPAFPTAFNRIFFEKNTRKAFEKLLDRYHHTVSEMFLRLDPFDEIPAAGVYTVRVLLVSPAETFSNAEGRAAAEEFRQKLEELLKLPCIDLDGVLLQADNRTSVQQIGEYVVWDFDFLTVRDDSEIESA